MKKLEQKGFTLVEGLLIVIALGIIVGVGFYIYNSQNEKTETPAIKSNQNKSNDADKKDYLVVKELGLRFDKTDLPGAYYKLGNAKQGYPKVPELTWINIYDTSYDNMTNSLGKKCGDDTYGSEIITVQVIKASDRDSKYANYTDAEIGIMDDMPTVVSDKYNDESDGFLFDYFKSQGVQAPLNCVAEVAQSPDYDETNAKDNAVVDKYNEDYLKLKKIVSTLEKN